MKTFWFILVFVIGIVAAWLFFKFVYEPAQTVSISKRKNNDIITLKLPNSIVAEVFGPKYWEAYNFLDQNIPCSICRDKAIPLGTFRHDIVNGMNEKTIFPFDKTNWKFWVNKINELDKKVS